MLLYRHNTITISYQLNIINIKIHIGNIEVRIEIDVRNLDLGNLQVYILHVAQALLDGVRPERRLLQHFIGIQ